MLEYIEQLPYYQFGLGVLMGLIISVILSQISLIITRSRTEKAERLSKVEPNEYQKYKIKPVKQSKIEDDYNRLSRSLGYAMPKQPKNMMSRWGGLLE